VITGDYSTSNGCFGRVTLVDRAPLPGFSCRIDTSETIERPRRRRREGTLSDLNFDLLPAMTRHHALVGWMLGSFLVTFLVTRAITRAIRRGRGPFRNASLAGVHVHHQVYGIFLLLGVGTAEFTYRPEAPWVDVLAVLFGAGAALTLDEFALWLHLDDVYWTRQGRSSVDAVLVAFVIGALLLVGADPFDTQTEDGAIGLALTVAVNLSFALVTILKGRTVLGVIGVFVPLLAIVAAFRLARPASPWARFPPGHPSRWDRLVDLFAVAPPVSDVPRSS
jgi:hypothetical protein